jgi:hypothetical protein
MKSCKVQVRAGEILTALNPYRRGGRVATRARVRKPVPPSNPAEDKRLAPQGKGKGVTGIGVQKVFQLRLDFLVSQKSTYEKESHASVMAEMERMIKERWPEALFTPTGGYYLIDGDGTYGNREVCRPQDFDHETMQRKSGTLPPSWSLNAEMQLSVERQLRVLRELQNPEISRQPGNLYTTQEFDRLKEISSTNNEKHDRKARPITLKNTSALQRVKSDAAAAANEKLDEIAAERPDLIQLPVKKKVVAKKTAKAPVKKFVRKK